MTALAGMAATQGAQLVIGAASALGQISAGRAAQRQYQQQAQQAELKGRAEAIAYKQKGAEIMANLNETLAAVIARSAAGNVDPTSGSARTIALASTAEGIEEANIAADNATAAISQGQVQADIYQQAGKTAMQTSMVQALGTAGTYAYRYGQLA